MNPVRLWREWKELKSLPPAEIVKGVLVVEPLGDGNARICEDVIIRIGDDEWKLYAGDVTDLASFPWYVRWYFNWTEMAVAAAWHDPRYTLKDTTKLYADNGFYRLSIANDPSGPSKSTSKKKAFASWVGLRNNTHRYGEW